MKCAAKILLVNPENKILLQLRDDKPTIPYPNHWASIGGGIEEGETPLEGLKREVGEEINSEITNIEFLGYFLAEELDFKVYLFKGKIKDKIEDIKITEGQKVNFFSMGEVEGLKMHPLEKKFILENKERIFSL